MSSATATIDTQPTSNDKLVAALADRTPADQRQTWTAVIEFLKNYDYRGFNEIQFEIGLKRAGKYIIDTGSIPSGFNVLVPHLTGHGAENDLFRDYVKHGVRDPYAPKIGTVFEGIVQFGNVFWSLLGNSRQEPRTQQTYSEAVTRALPKIPDWRCNSSMLFALWDARDTCNFFKIDVPQPYIDARQKLAETLFREIGSALTQPKNTESDPSLTAAAAWKQIWSTRIGLDRRVSNVKLFEEATSKEGGAICALRQQFIEAFDLIKAERTKIDHRRKGMAAFELSEPLKSQVTQVKATMDAASKELVQKTVAGFKPKVIEAFKVILG